LLNFIDPIKFNDSDSFLNEYSDMKDSSEAKKLHELIAPYILRRLKEDVEKSIPPKEEILVEVVMSRIQKKYYRAILDKNREFLQKGTSSNNMPNLINILMEIRKICNHPFLIKGVEDKLVEECKSEEEINDLMIKSSSKLILVDKLLAKLREGKHKVLIFSQMVRLLHILEDYLTFKKYPFERLGLLKN
jgi:chromodomain-helicase-DNA-binding protein 7